MNHHTINTRTIEVEKNSRVGWQKAYKKLCDSEMSVLTSYPTQYCFEVEVFPQIGFEETDITDLKYFLPILDELEKQEIGCMLKIKYPNADNRHFGDNIARLQSFFSILFSELYVDFSGKAVILASKKYFNENNGPSENVLENKTLNPIFSEILEQISTDEITRKKYRKKIVRTKIQRIKTSPKSNERVRHIIIPTIATEMMEKITFAFFENKNIKEYIDNKNYVFHVLFCGKTKAVTSDLFSVMKIDNLNDLRLEDLLSIYKKYASNPDNYKAFKGNSLSKKRKKEITSAVKKNIANESFNNDLEKIIYLYLLRNLIEQKEIFNFTESIEVDQSVMKKLSSDAKTYAEGLYQIIENACIHSKGKCAYFGMRIHKADRNAPPSSYEKNASSRIRLYKKYQHCFQDAGKGRTVQSYMFNDASVSSYIEFFVIDNATGKQGIVSTYVRSAAKSIDDIINAKEDNFDNPEDYYIHHYGLRWFMKIIDKNKGCVSILSPNGNEEPSYYCSGGKGVLPEESYVKDGVFATEYNILLPRSYSWQQPTSYTIDKKNPQLFEKILSEDIEFQKCEIDDFIQNYRLEKKSIIENLYKNKFKFTKKDRQYIHFLMNFSSRSMLEIFAKAMFKYIYTTYRQNSERKLYFVVDFGQNNELIQEFVRIFSIFYDKSNQSFYMDGVQIAVASAALFKQEYREVNFLIAGKNLESAYATANVFAYYNSESTLKFIPVLEYLTQNKDSATKDKPEYIPVAQFPFDLFLKDSATGTSWFLQRMQQVLENDIQEREYGCKISNIHIRISSRIHLGNFFEAELLFHNIGNVYRFAYLLARDIKKESETDPQKNIILLGYENYSSVLIQQVQNLLQLEGKTVSYGIVTTLENGESHVSYFGDAQISSPVDCYTIIPIGTTMSTIYKVHNAFLEYFQKNWGANSRNMLNYKSNYAIIAVFERSIKDEALKGIMKKYWEKIENDTITLQQQFKPETAETVKYYLLADSKWYDANDCNLCKETITPLIQVDKTSTIPNAIFELMGNNRKFFKNKDAEKKIEHLKPSISDILNNKTKWGPVMYSHLVKDNNHYQFLFDFKSFVEKARKKIIQWAKDINVDGEAFNIVFSPLSSTNSEFSKIVIDNVFSSSLRFLHLDIANTFKEDARVKFSYIAKEYASIKRFNPNAKINFYYIDDSIVTGQNIHRGYNLLKMLVEESKVLDNNCCRFKKIFLLINRSSYDTINTLVEKPKNDFHAFLHLYMPSYNINTSFCPGCVTQKKYERLLKRSVSNALSADFERLVCKHEKRTQKEYIEWIEDEIKSNHTYFAWMKLWLYRNKQENEEIKEIYNQMQTYMKKELESQAGMKEDFLRNVSKLTLQDFISECEKEDQKEKVIRLMRYIISERAFLRLETMNTSYEKLQEIMTAEGSKDQLGERNRITREIISDLILNDENDIEKILSYIKVISREQISNYYHIKVAIIDVLVEFLDNLLSSEETSESKVFVCDRACPAEKYQLIITIIHRLAMLQSSSILQEERVRKILKFFGDCYKQHSDLANAEEAFLFTEVPDTETMLKRYMKSIKTATMLNKDDTLCTQLYELRCKLIEEGGSDETTDK